MLDLKVVAVRNVARDIVHLRLAAASGQALPGFQPGAHLPVQVVIGGKVQVREYSLVNDGREPQAYEIAVLREAAGRGGSAAMHALQAGDRVQARPPVDAFRLQPARRHLLIAGGIGITPMFAMAQALHAQGADFALHYAARSLDRMAFADEVSVLPGTVLHVDDGDPARGIPLHSLLASPQADVAVYVCGPKGLIAAVIETARAQGWPTGSVHHESFDGAVALSQDREFTVFLRDTGLELRVAADETLLDALIRAEVEPLYDCRRGECGMCATDVVEGIPDHRDHALSAKEHARGRVICTCVSRSITPRLVLAL